MAIQNFSWVIQEKLGASALPGKSFFKEDTILADLGELYQKGIRCLVSLTDLTSPFAQLCKQAGLEWLYYPIPDFGIPSDIQSFETMISQAITYMDNNLPICVHCYAGIGRTGLVLTCLVGRYYSLKSVDAIAFVRKTRSAIETNDQLKFINNFLP